MTHPRFLPIARSLPLDVGIVHFVGIGGIGMSGIAEIMHNLGYKVQGSDLSENYNTERLRKLGVNVMIGQKAEHLGEARLVVISSAVKSGNPELAAARAKALPVVRRAEMLAELMRLKMSIAVGGTHGKTTTTSMLACLLEAAGLEPTVVNGGILNAHGTNAYLGRGDWMVVESDESDGSFIRLPATVAVVTNIDPEHLDYYGSFDAARAAYRQFVQNLPFYGFAAVCLDHPEVQKLVADVSDRRIVTYGTNPQADVRAVKVEAVAGGSVFDVALSERVQSGPRVVSGVKLPVPGPHNVLNALAAIAVAVELKCSDAVIIEAFAKFQGVKRRFTKTGEAGGITVIDDYGHHPVEIAATLKAARDALAGKPNQVVAVVQPHRFTRLRDLFAEFCTCFNDADAVIVADVYPAGEEPIEGIDKVHLVEGLVRAGHKKIVALDGEEALAKTVAGLAKKGDIVVCLGAGSISKWANALPKQLEAALKKGAAA
ncbi:MAG: UDP-N-acetylmuramate--L-alanine ligase [Alphaproteobacteria bacterium]|nr:UDP-N-acetylmuramate--L-alanine ligase [Alphaproteobacteria bacterium]